MAHLELPINQSLELLIIALMCLSCGFEVKYLSNYFTGFGCSEVHLRISISLHTFGFTLTFHTIIRPKVYICPLLLVNSIILK